MRDELAHCLLYALVLTTAGCGAIRSAPAPTADSQGMEYPESHSQFAKPNRAESEFNEAMALVAELRYGRATAKLLPLIARFEADGKPERAAEALFWVGYCYEKQGQEADAADVYNRVVRAYPQTSASHQASERLSLLTAQTDH